MATLLGDSRSCELLLSLYFNWFVTCAQILCVNNLHTITHTQHNSHMYTLHYTTLHVLHLQCYTCACTHTHTHTHTHTQTHVRSTHTHYINLPQGLLHDVCNWPAFVQHFDHLATTVQSFTHEHTISAHLTFAKSSLIWSVSGAATICSNKSIMADVLRWCNNLSTNPL